MAAADAVPAGAASRRHVRSWPAAWLALRSVALGSYLRAQSSPSLPLVPYSTYLMPRKPQAHKQRQHQAEDQAAALVGLAQRTPQAMVRLLNISTQVFMAPRFLSRNWWA